ncbi:ABC transporter ATP-binding protein/permease [Caulobacter sp. NIBR1757]|uniref:ABCB family ABC transporter ATP-binding protein/permease n=1 Tax=Caulobacter sp. NIBR1757 TaxID=3016000 RepID=UPI0022F10BD0|nr:ABC transporter ATP-binding protein/permease [Caulobacter sp. NIBR1757]
MADLFRLVLSSRAPGLTWRLTAALVFTLGGKVLGVLAPLLLGAAVNRLAAGQSPAVQVGTAFAGLILGWTAIRFLSAAAPQLRDVVFTPVAQAAQRRAAADAFGHALSLSIEFHQTKRTGSLSRIIDRGARSMDFLLRALVFNLGPTFIELIIAAVVLAKAYDWRFAGAAVGTVVVYGVLTFAISDWRIAHRRALNDADSEAAGRAVDALINYETVKAFGAETRAAATYEQALSAYANAQVLATTSLSLLNIAQAAIMAIGLAIMALLAGAEAQAGQLQVGDVTAAILILINLYGPLNILGFAYREIRQSFIDLEAMSDLRRQSPDVAEAPDAVDPPPADDRGGAVVFSNVGFKHGARSQGLEEVSFAAAPGETVALVGPSGAGKTTLVRLALRMIDPQSGAITLDGVDLRQLKMAALRSAIALVPQDVALFNDTLAANIAFARPDSSEEQIRAAADAAELTEFIAGLPEGLLTKVGERGLKLSGGERQRVGIARALLADPRVLILDEATSALDSRTEAAIQDTLRKARQGRTTLVVAHRLSTIADADRIIVLRRGRVVEEGRHEELLERGGEYAALWRRQTRGR